LDKVIIHFNNVDLERVDEEYELRDMTGEIMARKLYSPYSMSFSEPLKFIENSRYHKVYVAHSLRRNINWICGINRFGPPESESSEKSLNELEPIMV